ncbi:MAG: MaoC/PaaZ C-terminal domain-containing protein [Neisseriaceae bacterium]|nr:MaoC/PaaZ C-terminal domain-containing protein [Neisseriaceae bacterium]
MGSYNKDIELNGLPSLTKGYLKAAGQMITKSLTVKHGGSALPSLPAKRFILKNYRLNPQEVKKYTDNTQLANRNVLPITYLYSVAFPIVIKLLTEPDFPYVPVGLVHLYNTINQYKEVATDAVVDIYVHTENMREHRSGLLIDVVTEVYVGSELVWSQVSAMLRKQKTSLSGTPKESSEAFDKSNVTSQETVKATAEMIRQYASISGDRNPIHMSPITAKAFGFPQMIAHGSWMMARILSSSEEKLPTACTYKVEFGKPFLVPGSAELFVANTSDDNWSYSLEKPDKGKIILTAQVIPLEK